MRAINLFIENFCSIKAVDLMLANQGLVLITGQNEDAPKADSNGAGKSLLLEAFCWCVWGQTIRGLKGDEVVHEDVGKDCLVQLTFEEGGDEFRIVRTRKQENSSTRPNDLRVYKNEDNISQSSVATTQKLVDELLGMDFTTFCVMMPGAGISASQMTDTQIKTLLERLLQTEVLGAAYKKCRDSLKDTEAELALLTQKIGSLDKELAGYEEQLTEYKEGYETFEEKKNEELRQINDEEAAIIERITEQNLTISKKETAESNLKQAQERCKEILEDTETIAEIYNNTILECKKTLDDFKECERGHRYLLNDATASRINFPSSGVCPTCEQAVPKEHKKNHIQDLDDTIAKANTILHAISIQKSAEEDRIACVIQEKNKRMQKLAASHDLEKSSIEIFKSLITQAEHATERKKEYQQRVLELTKRRERLVNDENPFQALMATVVDKAAQTAAEAARERKQLKAVEHEKALYDYWVSGFSPQGVRSFLLEHITPVLNDAAKRYSDLLTDGEMRITFHTQQRLKSGKMKEKFNISVMQRHGGSSYTAASMGERTRANLVIAMALGDLAKMRASKRLSFRFLDEPFENVDESGTEAIVSLLNSQKEEFESVFVITHRDTFKQLFPKRLRVVKEQGFTRLESGEVLSE